MTPNETHQKLIDFLAAVTLRGLMPKRLATALIVDAVKRNNPDHDQAVIFEISKDFGLDPIQEEN